MSENETERDKKRRERERERQTKKKCKEKGRVKTEDMERERIKGWCDKYGKYEGCESRECCKTEQTGFRSKIRKEKRHVQRSEGVKEIKDEKGTCTFRNQRKK